MRNSNLFNGKYAPKVKYDLSLNLLFKQLLGISDIFMAQAAEMHLDVEENLLSCFTTAKH